MQTKVSRKRKEQQLAEMHRRISFYGTPEKDYLDSGLWLFLKYVKTKDEHDPLNPLKPLPQTDDATKAYILTVFHHMLKHQQLAVPKSRQIMMSWMAGIFAAWFARTGAHRLILIQSKKEEDAHALVSRGSQDPLAGRISFIENSLPSWLGDPNIRSGAGNNAGRLSYGNGSQIRGIPQGADQVRSHTPSLVISDEIAFQEEAESAYVAIRPAIQGGGRWMGISSANPGFFHQMVTNYDEESAGTSISGELPKGMRSWETRDGIVCLEVHYTSDPDKDPDRDGENWLSESVKGYPGGMRSSGWRREMEIDWDIMGGEAVFPFLLDIDSKIFIPRLSDDTVNNELELYGGFDYGTRNPSAFIVWGADKHGSLYAVWEYYQAGSTYTETSKVIKGCPYFDNLRYIKADPSIWSKTQQTASGLKSISELFAEEGVHFQPGRRGADIPVAERLLGDYWEDKEDPRAFVTAACPNLRRELTNLRWQEHKSALVAASKNNPEKIVDKDNHAFDATAYVVDSRPGSKNPPPLKLRRGTLAQIEREFDDQDARSYYIGG